MYKSKIRTSLYVLIGIFMSAVSMQAQAWDYAVSWYSDINFTFSTKGNKLKLANGNWVVSEIYAYDYVSKCVATNSGNVTLHTGRGNNGGATISSDIVKEQTNDNDKNKGTFFATGTLSLKDMYMHYRPVSGLSGAVCYEEDEVAYKADGTPYMKPGAPTGDCTEDPMDTNPNHIAHFCHAAADQKVEYRDNLYFPHIAVYVQVVEGNPDSPDTPPEPPYNTVSHGIAECSYDGNVSEDINGEFVTETKPTVCDVTDYPVDGTDPRISHVLSF